MATTAFETTIKNYLDSRAQTDSLFAEAYRKANKSIKECCRYIISRARKLGGQAVAVDDATVYRWAVHYYDKDDIRVEATAESARVSVPVAVTAPPKPAKPKTAKAEKKKKETADDRRQLSLFDGI